jgi:hypothetical protein
MWKLVTFLIVTLFVYGCKPSDGLHSKEQLEVKVRHLGHQFLLSVNDSTTRVLAIDKKMAAIKSASTARWKYYPKNLWPRLKHLLNQPVRPCTF